MKKRMLSILLAITMIMPLFTINIGGVESSEPMTATVNPAAESTKTGIDYRAEEIILTGSINGEKNSEYSINLSKETFTVPSNYKIAAYSTNGGTSWTAVTTARTFDNAKLANSLSSNITLTFTDKYEASRRRVPTDAVVVKFPKINKRPSLSSKDYTVNYQLGADNTGKTTGTWLLTERNGKTSVKQGIEIGVLNSAGKLDEKGYGRFYGANGSTNGIEIAALPASGKAVNPAYTIRKAPAAGSDGTYTAASKSVKITVTGQRAAPNYTVDKKKNTIAYPANTYIFKDKKTELKKTGGTVDIANYNGDVYLWSAPTSRTPTVSAMQKVSVTTAADGTLSYTTDTVTVLTEAALNAPAGAAMHNAPINAVSEKISPMILPSAGDINLFVGQSTTESLTVSVPFTFADLKSANTGVATVNTNTGIVTAAAVGTTNIYVEGDEMNQRWTVHVNAFIPVTNITGVPATAAIGVPLTLAGTAEPSGASQTITWSMVDEGTTGAKISGNTLTTTASGTVKVRATIINGTAIGTNYTQDFNITVRVPVSGITIVEPATLLTGETVIIMGTTQTFTANITPTNADTKTVTWESSNTAVAAVDANGKITTNSLGTATITVRTTDGGFTASRPIVVVPDGTLQITRPTATLVSGMGTVPWDMAWLGKAVKKEDINWETSVAGASITPSGLGVTGNIPGTANVRTDIPPNANYTVTPRNTSDADKIIPALVNGVFYANGFPLTVNSSGDGSPPVLTISPDVTEVSGTVGVSFTAPTFVAAGGTRPYTFEISEEGKKWLTDNKLTFNEAAAANGMLTIGGIPEKTGTQTITVRVIDAAQQTSNVVTLTIRILGGQVVVAYQVEPINGIYYGTLAVPGWPGAPTVGDGVASTNGTVPEVRQGDRVDFVATPREGYEVQKWLLHVVDVDGSGNWTLDPSANAVNIGDVKGNTWTLTGADMNAIPAGKGALVRVIFSKIPVYSVDFSMQGTGGSELSARGRVPLKGGTDTPHELRTINADANGEGKIEVLPNNSIIFNATPAENFRVAGWKIEGLPTGDTIHITPEKLPAADSGITVNNISLGTLTIESACLPATPANPTGGIYGNIVVTVTFSPLRPTIITPHQLTNGKVNTAYTFDRFETAEDEVMTWNFAKTKIENGELVLDLDNASNPQIGSSADVKWNGQAFSFMPPLSFQLNPSTGVLTLSRALTKGEGGTYTFGVMVTNPAGMITGDIFTLYIEDMFNVEYQIAADGVNGKVYVKADSGAEEEYTGKPGTNDAIRSKTNIPENTPVIFRAVPTDSNLYMTIWKVTDKSNNQVLVNTESNPSINDYGEFNDDRTIFTVSQLNKNIAVTVSFKPMPEYKVEFYAIDRGNEDSPGATGGAVSAMAYDREGGRTLFEGAGEQNRVRGGSDVEFTAHESTGWTVLEWRVSKLDDSGNVEGDYQVDGYGSTYTNKLTGNIRVVAVFTPKSTTPVTSVTVNPAAISIGETGTGTITANVLPQAADQRIKWSIRFNNAPGGVTLKEYLVSKLGITDPNNLQLNEVKNQAGDIITYSYKMRSSNTDPWATSQEIISIEPDSAQGVKITVGKPTKYGDYNDLVFDVTATSTLNKDKYKSSTVTITEYIPATGVSLQPKTLTMVVGNAGTLTATILPSSPPEPHGASNKNVTWSSSDSDIVFVDSNGKVTALGKGTATITVTTVDGSFTDTCVITVLDAFIELDKPNNYVFPTKVYVKPEEGSYDAGTHTVRITNKAKESVKVDVTLEGPHKDKFEVSPTSFENMPANSFSMLTITPKPNLPVGVYTAIVAIEGTSVAEPDKSVGTLKFEVSFRVVKDATEIPPPPSIRITVLGSPREPVSQNGRETYILYVGETLNVRADKISPQNPDAEISWKTYPADIVELRNNTGETNVITAKALGSATIEASYNPLDMIYIIVAGRPQIIMPEELTNLPDYGVQVPGGSLSQAHLSNAIIGTPYNHTLLTAGFSGYYSSTVSTTPTGSPPLYWRVTGGSLPPGLTLTQWIDGTTAPIGANHQAGSVIEGTPTAAGSGKLYTFTLEAGEIVYYAQGSNVIWRAPHGGNSGFSLACVNDSALCNHPTVITNPITGVNTVNNACTRFERVTLTGGRVVLFAPQMKAVRTMNIYVRTESYFAAKDLKITASGMTTGTVGNVSQNRLSMSAGTTNTVTPIISPANATIKDVIYESSNTTVATIDSSGKITAKEAGTALISVTTKDGHLSDTILVTVTKVSVAGISLNTRTITVGVGGTATLKATIRPSNASVKDVTWTTGDASIVSVDNTGKITGIQSTGATPVPITVTSVDNPGASATVQVTVSPLAVTGVTLKAETTLGIGDTETLLANVIPANASDKNVTWSSSDTAVATVNNVGLITGVTAGTATVTAKTADGSYTADCKVTILNSYNIKLEQAEGGKVTMPATKALSGAKVNLSVSPNPGYYLVGWETSPIDVAIVSGSFTMPAQNITVMPVFKKFTFMNEYIPPLNLDTTKPSYSFKFTTDIAHNSLGISLRATELAELARRNPKFTIDIETNYGIYQFPVNIMSIVPDISGILSRNKVNVNEIVFNIIITDKKNDKAVLDAVDYYMPPVTNIIGSAVDFTVEIARIDASGRPGNRIAVVDNLTEKVTRLIPLNPNASPAGQQWGAYKYNPQANQFEFVPHVTRNIEGNWYAAIMSNTNGIHVASKNPIGFADVAANQWYTPYVAKAAAKRLVQGMGGGLYQPDTNITRAQFVQMMANALQLPGGTSTPYSDVKETDWFYSAITRARSAGLLNKFTSSTFKPNQPITRGEITVILAAALRKYGFAPNDESIRRFQMDFVDSVSPENVGDAALVYSLGIMNGTGNGYYSPGGYTNRAQAATVQIRLLEILGFIDR